MRMEHDDPDQAVPDMTSADPLTLYLVKRLELVARTHLEEVVRPFGLTVAQYTALSVLRHRADLSCAQLARRSFVSAQAVNQVVTSLEQRGLIERLPDSSNRRVRRIALTEAGLQVLRDCDPGVESLERQMLAPLDPSAREALRESLIACMGALGDTVGARMLVTT